MIKGVRDGARYAARLPFSYYNCGTNTIADPPELQLLADIKNLTRTGYISGDNPNVGGTDNPVFHGWTSATITVTMSCDTDAGHTYVNKGIYTNTGGAPRIKVSAQSTTPRCSRSWVSISRQRETERGIAGRGDGNMRPLRALLADSSRNFVRPNSRSCCRYSCSPSSE